MQSAVIQLKEAIAANLQASRRVNIGGETQNGNDPDLPPDQDPERGFILTGTLHEITRTQRQPTDILGDIIRIQGHRRLPKLPKVTLDCYSVLVTCRLLDTKTKLPVWSGQMQETTEIVRGGRSPLTAVSREMMQRLASKVAAIVLSKAGAGATAQVTKKIENNHVTLNTGFVQGTREKMVFGVYRDGKEEPVCYVRVVSITRSSCRAEIGSIDFNRLARDKEGNYEKAFRADRILIDLIEAGMTVRSEN